MHLPGRRGNISRLFFCKTMPHYFFKREISIYLYGLKGNQILSRWVYSPRLLNIGLPFYIQQSSYSDIFMRYVTLLKRRSSSLIGRIIFVLFIKDCIFMMQSSTEHCATPSAMEGFSFIIYTLFFLSKQPVALNGFSYQVPL